MKSFYCWFFVIFLLLNVNAIAVTYKSAYGQNRTHNITVVLGNHKFEVDGIAQYKYTEWYVDGVYIPPTDYSGVLATDPDYTHNFSNPGTTQIKAIVYNNTTPWTVKETHIWNVTLL